MATAVARLTSAPAPVRSVRPEVPPSLEDVVARSLARDPEYRYQSARAVKDALAPGGDTAPTGPLAPPRPARPTGPPSAAGGAGGGASTQVGAPSQRGPAPVTRARGARRWPWIVLILLLLAGGVGAAYVISGSGGGSGTRGNAAAAPDKALPIVSAKDFDPEGNDGQEDPDRVGNAIDGNPSTAWFTEQYQAPATHFGGTKDGVGLILQLDSDHNVSTVNVTADDTNWSAQIYVAEQSGTDLAAWGQPLASKDGLGHDASFTISPAARGRFVLLWLTLLPAKGKLGINEVAIAGQ
jgi:hypothetical protein